jgi:UDP-GlcNAc:undecaprenyl-phosphate GlcNAc-1-phosphate transferase
MGLTHRRAVLMLYGVSVVFTGLAIAISIGRSWEAGLAMLAASLVLIGLIKFAGYFEYLKPRARESSRLRSRDGERLRFALPKAVKTLGEAQSEEELFAELGTIASEAQLDLIDLIELSSEGTAAKPASVWQRHPKADKLRDDLVSVSFPIGPEQKARAFLCFRWESAAGEVTPQAEILLQVLVDIVAAELTRLRSRLAPEPPAPRLDEHEHEHRKDELLRQEDAEAGALMTREERIVRAAR